ncbi:hypothetical protein OG738_03745 [Amycolatopsis sp. NBC_01488]|uniref:hypothetical protein n=1 Tax=Amycolatopsis sp. NBC_01488 TaxID=2903563 RepID=UPI002E2E8137|nr:hypothetical protein [Amycolatopsis sp. NBC_01488]
MGVLLHTRRKIFQLCRKHVASLWRHCSGRNRLSELLGSLNKLRADLGYARLSGDLCVLRQGRLFVSVTGVTH